MFIGNAATIDKSHWRIDDDGFLRITARVLKPGRYDYGLHELPQSMRENFKGREQVIEAIDANEFTEDCLKSLEGKPVIVGSGHDWRNPDNTMSDGVTVGSIAGKPVREADGSIVADMLITQREAIAAIQNKGLREVSAAYDAVLDTTHVTEGADATQRGLRFNHVLLLPEGKGRCGADVRILNSSTPKGERKMVKVKIGNADYEFADDAAPAAQTAADAVNNELAEKDKTITVHLEKLTALQTALDAANTALAAFKLEEENEEYEEEAGALAEGATDDEKAQMAAAVTNCKTPAEKRKALVAHVLNTRGVDAKDYDDNAVRTAMTVLIAETKRQKTLNTKPPTKMPDPGMPKDQTHDKPHPVMQRKQ